MFNPNGCAPPRWLSYCLSSRMAFTIAVLACVVGLIAMCAFRPARARDLDGHYAAENPQLHAWFNSLSNHNGGMCCSFADGKSVEDVDWRTAGDGDCKAQSGYCVRIEGRWYDVPKSALVEVPNRLGQAVVWPYTDGNGDVQIRCFMPGGGV